MSKKVYIVCEPTKTVKGEKVSSIDLTPAAQWGEPVILLQSTQSMLNPSSTIEVLNKKLASFSDDDFLIPVGDPTLMCAAAMVAASINDGRVRFLKWDRHMGRYIPILVDIKDIAYGPHS